MKQVLVCVSVIAALILSAGAVQAADKIGFVDIRKVMTESEAGKRSAQEIMSHVERKQSEIEAREAELQKMKDDLERQVSVLTETAFRERELEYQRKFREYKRFVEDANEEMRMRERRITQALIPDIQRIINEVGAREGYTAIFDVGTAGLLYSTGKNDITDRVVEAYNTSAQSKR